MPPQSLKMKQTIFIDFHQFRPITSAKSQSRVKSEYLHRLIRRGLAGLPVSLWIVCKCWCGGWCQLTLLLHAEESCGASIHLGTGTGCLALKTSAIWWENTCLSKIRVIEDPPPSLQLDLHQRLQPRATMQIQRIACYRTSSLYLLNADFVEGCVFALRQCSPNLQLPSALFPHSLIFFWVVWHMAKQLCGCCPDFFCKRRGICRRGQLSKLYPVMLQKLHLLSRRQGRKLS